MLIQKQCNISFTVNLDSAGDTFFFIYEEAKETNFNFSQRTGRVL